MQKLSFLNYVIAFDESDRWGYEYLTQKINPDEAKVYFEYARNHNEAQFETQNGQDYSLVHKGGLYTIVNRKK
jgi:hypothetical protein